VKLAERPLRPAEAPRDDVWRGGGVRRTSNRNAGSSAPSFSRSLSAFGWTVLNTGPRTGSTTATTTFVRLGVSKTIPSRARAAPETLTRSPISVESTTPSLPFVGHPAFARAATTGRSRGRYGEGIDPDRQRSQTARKLARAVDDGRNVGAALRHLDVHGSEPEAQDVADALARFLVARCDSHHAGWRVVRQVVVDSAADAPWERCARRAVPLVAQDLISLSGDRGRMLLAHAQHIAAQRRAEEIAVHVDQSAVLKDLGLRCGTATPDRWRDALSCAVQARSREQVARAVDGSLRE
jgi:hypothetical protein